MDNAPILAAACPFLRYVHHGKVEDFQQTVICWEYGLGVRHLAELVVEALYGVGGVDKSSEFRWGFEIGTEIDKFCHAGAGKSWKISCPTYRRNYP